MKQKIKVLLGICGLILILGGIGRAVFESNQSNSNEKNLADTYEHLVGEEREGLDNDESRYTNGKRIVIDPGHGGYDPGKISINGALEKDINLSISLKVEEMLLDLGYEVIMTRRVDSGMTENGNELGKASDLDARVITINESSADMAISIHQNSYTSEEVKGAQVFYYEGSINGEKAASVMQECLREIDSENHRQIKGNSSYYLLKRTTVPTIIVECGFLSNMVEANKLCDDTYQTEVAVSIVAGVEEYLQ